MPPHDHYDIAVIGAGFGGLGSALTLAEAGQRVVLFEALGYPGGCASTFSRKGYRFEAGATLFSGLAEGQLLRRWVDAYAPELELHFPEPVLTLRSPDFSLPVSSDRARFLEALLALPGVPEGPTRAFFDEQQRVAEALWALFEDPGLLPPFRPGALLAHLGRSPRYLPLLRLVGRPLEAALRRHGLADCAPLRQYLDAVCQITVQASAAQAEAPFAMGAMDYYFQGAGHVAGGIGELAWALARAVESLGGSLRMPARVRGLTREGAGWRVEARGGAVTADAVLANLLPQDLARLAGLEAHPRLRAGAERVAEGWGAAMLYLAAGPGASDVREAHHIELILDPSAPFQEGNHLFCSLSAVDEPGRAPSGERTVTVSTHVPMKTLLGLSEAERGAYIQGIQARMRAGIAERLPRLHAAITLEMPASPRTFARFTRRHLGYVGGVPRTAGLQHYAGLFPSPVEEGLYMVGDSVFPGQSTLAVAIGGVKAAEHWLRGRGRMAS
ncbi:MAG: FAD-dependent oxidoreductase [Alphaproteobacteria bacterium]|nr:FAD-dependent oxidoreductase [Alphaproteobacteria bacterium]